MTPALVHWLLGHWKPIAGAVVGLALIAGAATIYRAGGRAGTSAAKSAVQTETIRTLDRARLSKEKTDGEVVRTPYDDRVDGLR